ncbi:MAG: TetR/AcrR family transcriptional regulator [Actinobacteria bacterium]|nr:TetR/AcrR family transcriptional regulator [Actinomycetota bacterium]MDI6830145.1 TetR/AcrR family transcriptional regulator [Actinomycetota bacterium]
MAKRKETPRTEKGQQTRQAIFDTAIDLFAKKGYDKVTVDDICTRVGVTKGAFYNHFRSKDQIILEEFMRMDEHYVRVAEEISALPTSLEKLRAFNHAAITLMSDIGVRLMKVLYHSQIAPHMNRPYLADSRRYLYRITNQLIREGQERGEIRDDIPSEEMASMFIDCFRGQIYHWCLANGSFDLVGTCDLLMQLLLDSLKPR